MTTHLAHLTRDTDSSLGWVNDFVGVPYQVNGRTTLGWDCWGLVVAVYRDRLGLELPDWRRGAPYDLAAHIRIMNAALETMKARPLAELVPGPEPWALVFVMRHSRPWHVGVAAAGGVLHCCELAGGTVFEPMQRWRLAYPVCSWWRWCRA